MSKIKEYLEMAHDHNVYLPTRTVWITGTITEDVYEQTCKNLHALDTEPETVTIYLNSEGGDFNYGMSIYNTIKGMKSYVRCIVWNSAQSIASVILCACDERIIVPTGFLMIHEGSDTSVEGTRSVQQIWAKFEEDQMRDMENIYLEKIKAVDEKYTRKKLQKLLKTDTILKAEEAKRLGLVDRIEEVI